MMGDGDCYWCSKPGAGEVIPVWSAGGVAFDAHLHTRVCKKAWLADAAKIGTLPERPTAAPAKIKRKVPRPKKVA